jgi:large subunit ribosomal protein L18e
MKTNNHLQQLIASLKELGYKENARIWSRIASDLEGSTTKRSVVNLSKLSFVAKEGETVIVPGKVLGGGQLDHKVNVAAYTFSKKAKEQIEALKGKALTIQEFMKENPKGQKVRIIG